MHDSDNGVKRGIGNFIEDTKVVSYIYCEPLRDGANIKSSSCWKSVNHIDEMYLCLVAQTHVACVDTSDLSRSLIWRMSQLHTPT